MANAPTDLRLCREVAARHHECQAELQLVDLLELHRNLGQ